MKTAKTWAWTVAGLIAIAAFSSQSYSQNGPDAKRGITAGHGPGHGAGPGQGFGHGRGHGHAQGLGRGPAQGRGFRGGHGRDATFSVDRDDFHFLLQNHDKIRRVVTNTDSGVETVTESDSPDVADRLRKHVRSMHARLNNQQAIRMHDPLYVEVFRNADKIKMKIEDTEHGVRVVETSTDTHVVKLIQEHAKVVSGFAAHGFEEAHKNHAVPGTELADSESLTQCPVGCPKEGCAGGACKPKDQADDNATPTCESCKRQACKEKACKEKACDTAETLQ